MQTKGLTVLEIVIAFVLYKTVEQGASFFFANVEG